MALPTPAPHRFRFLLGLAAALLIAAALRLRGLDLFGFWSDEVYSARLALRTVVDLVAETSHDVHPPLYYVLLHGSIRLFGSSDWAIRSMSVALDLAGAVAVFDLARTVTRNQAVAWTALAFHVVSPFAILYAQEARMYSLLLLASALSTSFLVRGLERGARRDWAVYLAATLAVLYTHIFGVFLYLAQVGFTAWRWSRRGRPGGPRAGLRWAALQAGLMVAFAPWALVILRQALWAGGARAQGDWWIPVPPFKALVGPLWTFVGQSYPLLAVAGGLLGYLGYRVWRDRRREAAPGPALGDAERLVLLALCVATPILLSFAESRVGVPIFVARFMMPGFPAFLVLLAWGVNAVSPRWAAVGSSVAVVALSVAATFATNYEHSFKSPTPVREQVLALAGEDLSGTEVALSRGSVSMAGQWYADQRAPAASPLRRALTPETAGAPLPLAAGTARLVWVGDPKFPPPDTVKAVDGRTFVLTERLQAGNLQRARYEAAR